MGKFFNGRVRKDRGTLIKYGIIAAGVLLIILLFILIAAGKNKKSDAILELKDSLEVEVNSELPSKLDFFTKFENFDENLIDISDFDITTIGEYTVTITAEGHGSEDIIVNVVDTTPPVLTLQDVEIPSEGEYAIEDFVESCTDNSDGECIVEYYAESLDQNGNPIDYSSFTEDNKYLIKIIAKDESGNATPPQDIYLTIGEGQTSGGSENPIACNFGNLSYNKETHYYPIAVIVGDQINNCALNRDLWDSASVQTPVNNFYDNDYKRLKNQLNDGVLKEHFPNGAKIVAYPHYVAVLNEDLKGLVGYAIYVKVYVADATTTTQVDSDENLKIAYYLRTDGTRDYEVNKFDLGE